MIGVNYSQAGATVRASLDRAASRIQQSLERLSTGKKINRAADDPAGLIASEKLGQELTVVRKEADGLVRENLLFAAKDGAIAGVTDLTLRLQGLVVTAANRDGLSPGELDGIQTEASSILKAIDTLSQTQRYNGFQILQGYSSNDLGLRDAGFDLIDGDIEAIQDAVDGAADRLSRARATIGAEINKNDSQIRVLQEREIQLAGTISTIVDADYAKEVSELTRNQVLQAASTQLISAERAQRETALALLASVSGR